ncbi:MAG: lysylphosphatidylglycerol synthase domain-containing protein, partial [Planctomycetaceae bacterium]
MNSRTKKICLSIVKFAIPMAIIGWLLWRMEPEQWELLREQPKNYPLLVSALLVALFAIALSFVRWWLLVRCQGIDLSVIEAMRLGSIGFLLSFVSAGSVGGDLFKAIFLANRSPGKRIEAIASVVVDRGLGLLGLLLLVSVSLAFLDPHSATTAEDSNHLNRIGSAAVLCAGVGMAVLAVLILGGRPIDAMVRKASLWPVVGGAVGRIAGPLRMFHRHPLAFGISLVMS